jgi:hypothetical protein
MGLSFVSLDAVLAVVPADEPRRAEPRRIDREARLDGAERQGAADDHGPEVRGQFLFLHVAVDLVGVQQPGQVPAPVRLLQVAVEAAAGQGRPHLQADGEEAVGVGHARLPGVPVQRRVDDAGAQVGQQDLQAVLLLVLRLVVDGPVLLVGRLLRHFVGHHGRLTAVVPLLDKTGRVDVLARLESQREVLALASVGRQGDAVGAAAALRGDVPRAAAEGQLAAGRDFQALQFPHVHVAPESITADVRV